MRFRRTVVPPLKIALRFMALVGALTLITAALVPPEPASTPYLSSLSDLTVSAVLAKPCEDKVCATKPNGTSTCEHQVGSNTNCGVRHNGVLCMQPAC